MQLSVYSIGGKFYIRSRWFSDRSAFVTYKQCFQALMGIFSSHMMATEIDNVIYCFGQIHSYNSPKQVYFDTEQEALTFIERIEAFKLAQVL